MNESDNTTVYLGKYGIPDAKQILDALEAADISFEIERDDSRIRNLSPTAARSGGMGGHGVFIVVYVPEAEEAAARAVLSTWAAEQAKP